MFDRPSSNNDIAVLVSIDFGSKKYQNNVEELIQLAQSAKVKISRVIQGKRNAPDPALFVGKGKAEEIALAIQEPKASLVIFNHELSGVQERNLEKELKCRVIDRTSLILDIFAQRARSHEGKLQVELAQLQHLSTRLVRGWTHLERQKGGIGLRGPGETQLETDRRLITNRMKLLKDRLSQLQRQRQTQRRARRRSRSLAVSLVGYTNAGKSTLFNKLTHAKAYAADQLFATLDTMARKLFISDSESIVISDTVGFIRELPHSLVASFHATLEETAEADLLLHVVDASHPNRNQQIEEVQKVLTEIGAHDIPQILIFNKCDLGEAHCGIDRDEYGRITQIRLSAKTGEGSEFIKQLLMERIAAGKPVTSELSAPT